MTKEQIYTLRWNAMQIARLSPDPKVDLLAISQIEILSQLLGEPVPEEFKPPEPSRPNMEPVPPSKNKQVNISKELLALLDELNLDYVLN